MKPGTRLVERERGNAKGGGSKKAGEEVNINVYCEALEGVLSVILLPFDFSTNVLPEGGRLLEPSCVENAILAVRWFICMHEKSILSG